MVSKAAKLLLKNTIQSTEHQNKRKEENEMWKLYQKEREDRKRKHCLDSYERKEVDRSVRPSDEKKYKSDNDKPNNYWLKKLMTAEESIASERWGHNGFKELYSNELKSSESSDESEAKSSKKKSKKKKKKHKKHHKKHKHKRK